MIIDSGSIRLEVEAYAPQSPKDPLLVLAHPHPRMGGTMQNKVVDQLYRRASERGWGAVRFNFRGVGQSTGTFDQGTGETEDVLGVLAWACREFNREPATASLVGYSFGSWVSAKAAATLPALERLVLIAPPVALMDFSPLLSVTHPKDVFVAEQDEISPLEKTEEWFQALRPPKAMHLIPKADHFFAGTTRELLRTVFRSLDR